MAETAANFAFTSEGKPSIFEVIAQNSLNVTLHPALHRIAEFLSESSPKYFGWLYTNYEEAFLVLNGLLQYYYVKKYDASFSEYFYGLKRITSEGKNLSETQKRLCLIFLVLLPYLKRKLDQRIDLYQIEKAEHRLGSDFKSKIKNGLISIRSSFEFSYGLYVLVNYLRYMSDKTVHQRPSLQLLKLQLVLGEQEDVAPFWGALFKRQLSLKEIGSGLLKHGLRTSLEIGAFFVQFLQVWSSERQGYGVSELPTVPPPEVNPGAKGLRGKCPVCLQPWKIPTVLPTSGYVFCFGCIVTALRQTSRCPVTEVPSRASDVVRLYD